MFWEIVLTVCVVVLTLVYLYRIQLFDWAYAKCNNPVTRHQVLQVCMSVWVLAISVFFFAFNQLVSD